MGGSLEMEAMIEVVIQKDGDLTFQLKLNKALVLLIGLRTTNSPSRDIIVGCYNPSSKCEIYLMLVN